MRQYFVVNEKSAFSLVILWRFLTAAEWLYFRVYNVKMNPKYQNGEMTEERIFKKILSTFELGSAEMDGTVTYLSYRPLVE